MSRILTLETLTARKACAEQVDLFRERFGASVEITKALCLSVAGQFDWDWAARNLLSRAAGAEYDRVREAAEAEYDRVRAPAWAEYDRVCASAFGRLYCTED